MKQREKAKMASLGLHSLKTPTWVPKYVSNLKPGSANEAPGQAYMALL